MVNKMNERIRQLADKIWAEEYWDNPNTDKLLPAQLDKFAKLIVRECVDTVQKRYMGDNNREDMEVRRCVEDLKQHFGVEE
jgi:hypothetical protein